VTEKFSWVHLSSTDKTITLIDTPGHPDYYKNKVSGIFNSDFGILVVDVKEEEGEGVMEGTLEALYLLKGLEIPLIAVVFSKLDAVDYSKERFEEVKNDVLKMLKDLNIDTETVKMCPTSAKDGLGITNEKVWVITQLSAKLSKESITQISTKTTP
jgi:translation elongation factor EF-1alpha